jgi:hypothetical protein
MNEEHIQIYLEYKTDQENWFDHIEAIQKNIKEIREFNKENKNLDIVIEVK